MKFTEIPWFILKKYVNEVLDDKDPSEYTSAKGGILFKNNSGFITKNTNPFQLYRKNDTSNYEEVKASIEDISCEEDDVLKLKRLYTRTSFPSDEILRTVTEFGYNKITYDIYSDTDYSYNIENADEIYIRKDSLFNQWLKNNNYLDYSNLEKIFLYLGKGYKDDKNIKIYHYALKNWILNALPDNNRNNKLDYFIRYLFDDLEHRLYESQRKIYSLIDPFEIEEDKIGWLSLKYNEDPLSSNISTYKKRIYVDNLINWLKKKGTYSALFIIWYILTKETQNTLTIYDGWHESLPTSASPENYLEWYDYTKYYTSSLSADYPREYSLGNKVLSTHYKVEFDINSNPFGNDVLSKELINDFIDKWEQIRPVTRFAHYHLKCDILLDFSGSWIPFYFNPIYNSNIYSKSLLFTETTSGASINIQPNSSLEWGITHNLESENILVHTYNFNLERIEPKNVEIINSNSIRIYWGQPVGGSAFITLSDYTRNQEFILNDWTITHLLNSKYILSQFYDTTENNFVYSNNITATDENTLNIKTYGIAGRGFITNHDYIHTQSDLSSEWIIKHNLNYIGVMLDIYDENDEKVIPKSINLNSDSTCIITFSNPIKGYCGVKAIGNPAIRGKLDEKFNSNFNVKLGSGTDLDNWNYNIENDLKSNFYILECDSSCFSTEETGIRFNFTIPKNIEGNITEIGIFDKNDDLTWIIKINNIYKHKKINFDLNLFIQYQNIMGNANG